MVKYKIFLSFISSFSTQFIFRLVFASHSHDSNFGHSNSGGFATLKTSNFIHIDTIEIGHKDIVRENFKLNVSICLEIRFS